MNNSKKPKIEMPMYADDDNNSYDNIPSGDVDMIKNKPEIKQPVQRKPIKKPPPPPKRETVVYDDLFD